MGSKPIVMGGVTTHFGPSNDQRSYLTTSRRMDIGHMDKVILGNGWHFVNTIAKYRMPLEMKF